MSNLADRLPVYMKGHDPNKIITVDVCLPALAEPELSGLGDAHHD
jgi:hypothetical protein